ncbi:hypothetical protein DPV73_18000 [Leptospira mayottensis]|nr:hypothetical protein DPV73_18000 [Leptospira mayottensis]
MSFASDETKLVNASVFSTLELFRITDKSVFLKQEDHISKKMRIPSNELGFIENSFENERKVYFSIWKNLISFILIFNLMSVAGGYYSPPSAPMFPSESSLEGIVQRSFDFKFRGSTFGTQCIRAGV